ncbi:MAG: L-threonylcarbamoyladenylate synthase [Candidatus Bathyarchaeota archaeon]|nr:L-threonylcarbamoyladenylate synthase [Candidatus Bathyarchaeota archaeon]
MRSVAMEILEAADDAVRRAAAIIQRGGVVIYPTETVYGLGCNPTDADATRRVCDIKGRADKPMPLACVDVEAAQRIVSFNPAAERVAARFWPGPLMLVLPAVVEYPVWVTQGASTLGVRVPDHDIARRLAGLSGGVIVSTSANRSGKSPPATAREAADEIGGEVDLILDGGASPLTQPSTVLDLSGERPQVLRVGPITEEQLWEALSA